MSGKSLLNATKKGDILKVLDILGMGCEAECCVNATDHNGTTALIWSMTCNHHLIGMLLLNKGANPNIVDQHNWSALHAAARKGHKESVIHLLKKGADPNIKNLKRAETRTSTTDGDIDDAFEYLDCPMVSHVDTDSTESRGNTPLHLACKSGGIDVVKILLQNGADPDAVNDIGDRPVDLARREGHSDIADMMRNSQREDRFRAALYAAVSSGNYSLCQQLLPKSAMVNLKFDSDNLLNTAWRGGHVKIMKLLVTYNDWSLVPRCDRSSTSSAATIDDCRKKGPSERGSSKSFATTIDNSRQKYPSVKGAYSSTSSDASIDDSRQKGPSERRRLDIDSPDLQDCRHITSSLTDLTYKCNSAASDLEILKLDLHKQTKLVANLHRKIAYMKNYEASERNKEKASPEQSS